MKIKKKAIALPALLVAGTYSTLMAQTTQNANKALSEIAAGVSGLFDNAWKVALAIAALIAIVGSINVYSKWHKGDPNVSSAIAGWVGAVVGFILMGVVLKAVFTA